MFAGNTAQRSRVKERLSISYWRRICLLSLCLNPSFLIQKPDLSSPQPGISSTILHQQNRGEQATRYHHCTRAKFGSFSSGSLALKALSRITKSDTGTCIPESGLFGFMISVTAMLGAATMYVRYKIVLVQNSRSAFLCRYFNIVSLLIGVIGCIGMGIVASFQETSVTKVHDIGALLTFIFGVFYIFLQSIISYKSCPEWNKRSTCHIRMFISLSSILAVFPSILLPHHCHILLYKMT